MGRTDIPTAEIFFACLEFLDIQNMDIHQKGTLFFNLPITIFSVFTYFVYDKKVKKKYVVIVITS